MDAIGVVKNHNEMMKEKAMRFLELKKLKSESADRAAKIQAEITEVEEYLLDQISLTSDGVGGVIVNGKFVRPLERHFASPKPGRKEALHKALRDNGYEDLVKTSVNKKSLVALLAEFERDNVPIPTAIAAAVNRTSIFYLSATAAPTGAET